MAKKVNPKPDESRRWLAPLLAGAAIVLVTLAVYLPAMKAGFIWDDDSMLTANPLVQSPDGLRAIWFSTEPADYWPLTYSSLWLEWRMWGMNASGYHVTNILLHAFSAVLLWRVLLRMRVPGAWVAALIFAVHPVNVESVAWITERKNTLAMCLGLLALLWFLRFYDESRIANPESRARKWYGLALLAFTLSLLAKTSAVMLPVVLALCVWWRSGANERQELTSLIRHWLVRLAPFFAVSLGLGLATVWFQTNRAIGDDVVRPEGFLSRLAGAAWAIWFYLYKALFPISLSFVYPRWEISPASLVNYLPLLVVGAVLALALKFRRTWGRPVMLGLGCFLLMLLPVLGFFEIYFHRYSLVADHWQYFALPATISLIAAGLCKQSGNSTRKKTFQIVGAGIVLLLSVLTWRQAGVYVNTETLWRDTLKKNPKAWLALNNLGLLLAARGELAEAEQLYRRSLEINPRQMEGHNNLGEALALAGRNAEAGQSFLRAAGIAPRSAVVQMNLGKLAERGGDVSGAQSAYQRAVELSPNNADGYNSLGCLLAAQGKLDEAMTHFREALRINPSLAEVQFNAGNAVFSQGKAEEAISFYRAAIKSKPDHAEARINLGLILSRMGRGQEAVEHFEAVLRYQPDNVAALMRLAWIFSTHSDARIRNGARAVVLAEKAAKLAADDPTIMEALAAAHAETGDFSKAAGVAQQARQLAVASGRANVATRIQAQLESYQAGKAWRQ